MTTTAAGGPQLADVRRLAQRLLRLAVRAARAEDQPVQQGLAVAPGAGGRRVRGGWRYLAGYDHVNLQAGLDAWLSGAGRAHKLVGLTGFRRLDFGLADLLQPGGHCRSLGVGSAAMVAQPAGRAG